MTVGYIDHPAKRVTMEELARLPVERLARLLLDRAAEDPALLSRLRTTIDGQPTHAVPPSLIADSPAMRRVTDLLGRFTQTEEPILITGESGTGKEVTARAIHSGSARRNGPFVAVNCAAIPATLVASELFGYEKGAFTGAASRTRGQIEHASRGTLFLDEIGDMPPELQGHLLRFLQEGQIIRVGGREPVPVDVRVVAATNVRLREAIAQGRFREDLYYRLAVLTLHLPPLRERRADIIPLARQFLRDAARDYRPDVQDFDDEALALLYRQDWPGNVRELMSAVRRAVIVGTSPRITAGDLAGHDATPAPPEPRGIPRPGSAEERQALHDSLHRSGENVTQAAQDLGVSRVTLYRMLRRHGITLTRGGDAQRAR